MGQGWIVDAPAPARAGAKVVPCGVLAPGQGPLQATGPAYWQCACSQLALVSQC